MDLIKAILKNNIKKVQQLLESGSDPNAYEDCDKITPLHFAAQKNDLLVAALLIDAGANVHAESYPEGETPLDVAKLHRHKEMIELLSHYSGNATTTH